METDLLAPPKLTGLTRRYREVRSLTERLCETLKTEDFVVQTMTDVSPTKWHLAHTTWFFETFILKTHYEGYRPFHPSYAYLFNSYYVQAGERHARAERGALTRPTVAEVFEYRAYVDLHMSELLDSKPDLFEGGMNCVLDIGLNHEQQHQELLLTDIKHVFSVNPLRPAFRELKMPPVVDESRLTWTSFKGGVEEIGHSGGGFCYDNERPRHRQFLEPFEIANRPVSNAEFIRFIEDGGYEQPELWLSEGWDAVERNGWQAPGYWEQRDGTWKQFTLGGMEDVRMSDPVHHVSYYEADAYARWVGVRLPTEAEWEVAAGRVKVEGNFVDDEVFVPVAPPGEEKLEQMFGNLWEWTSSHYSPYPGYRAAEGAIGEYNGKFMVNQFILRGGSLATSKSHIRQSYRNFFHPPARWQLTGIRLARGGRGG